MQQGWEHSQARGEEKGQEGEGGLAQRPVRRQAGARRGAQAQGPLWAQGSSTGSWSSRSRHGRRPPARRSCALRHAVSCLMCLLAKAGRGAGGVHGGRSTHRVPSACRARAAQPAHQADCGRPHAVRPTSHHRTASHLVQQPARALPAHHTPQQPAPPCPLPLTWSAPAARGRRRAWPSAPPCAAPSPAGRPKRYRLLLMAASSPLV